MEEVVYIRKVPNEDCFRIGRTNNPSARRGDYASLNPRLKIHRRISTPDYIALEELLHNELAEKRILGIPSRSWYAATSTEIDAAIQRAKGLVTELPELKKKVAKLKNIKSDGTLLTAEQRHRDIYNRLVILAQEESAIRREIERLRIEIKVNIGQADGIEGFFRWVSEPRRDFQTTVFAREYPDLFAAFLRKDFYVRKLKLWNATDEDAEETAEIVE